MELDDVKQLVRNAAEARATRVFPPLIRASQVKEEPMTINRFPFAKVVSSRLRLVNPSEHYNYEPRRYLERFGGKALWEILMPRVEGGAGFVLAGGALHSSLGIEESVRGSDLDFFPVGLTEEQANKMIQRLISIAQDLGAAGDDADVLARVREAADWRGVDDDTLLDHLELFGNWQNRGVDSSCYGVYRTPNAVTITLRDVSIQLVTRMYPSREAVVRDFDIGPCQVLWDGFDVFMTELGALAYSTGCFPLELDHCTCPRTYARRLHKYLKRGYTLLLPDADPDRLPPKGSIFVPGLGMTGLVIESGRTIAVDPDDFHDTVDDDSASRPTRPHLEIGEGDPCASAIMSSTRENPAPGTAYLYRLIDYNPVGGFIANLVALVRGEAFRVLYYDAGRRMWSVCSVSDLPHLAVDAYLEIQALTTSFEYDHELRDAMTIFCPSLSADRIYARARARLGDEDPRQEIEWSYEPPRGTPISPDEWYGDFIDNSWRIKRY
jgi:hypothetical protein